LRFARDDVNPTNTGFVMATEFKRPEQVVINVSLADPSQPDQRFKGEVEEFANKHLVLLTDEEIDVSARITAQGRDLLFMGNVLNCAQTTGGRWKVSINVSRTLMVI